MFGKMRAAVIVCITVMAVALGGIGLASASSRDGRATDPQAVVDRFYQDYLDAIGTGETRSNPLADGSYRQLAGLHPACIAQVDALLASFAAAEMPGAYDPFLLAQDIPTAIYTEEAIIEGDRAYVPVTSSFATVA